MAYANGYIPRSALSPITRAVNGEQAYLTHEAAAAFMAMNAESERDYGVTLRVSSARTAYRPYADQLYFWNQYLYHGGNLAARPGTSNHGLGLAVDLATEQMRRIVDKIGHKYGWAKEWSDAQSEWWHLRYRSGVWHGHVGDPIIKKGSTKRDAIRTLQKLLRSVGYKSVSVNGKYDLRSRIAVRRFQRKHKLPVDGVVGARTWAALRKVGR